MERAQSEEERCQYKDCKHRVHGAARHCTHHGGVVEDTSIQKRAANTYRLQNYQARVNQFAADPNIKSLRAEIGILRLLIEGKINNCGDDYDLMLQSSSIAALVAQANTLVTSCHRIETLTGALLDKQALAEFAVKVVKIISDNVEADQAELIADKILEAMPREEKPDA